MKWRGYIKDKGKDAGSSITNVENPRDGREKTDTAGYVW